MRTPSSITSKSGGTPSSSSSRTIGGQPRVIPSFSITTVDKDSGQCPSSTPSSPQTTLSHHPMEQRLLLLRICRTPYVVVHLLELFKKTKNNTENREQILREIFTMVAEKEKTVKGDRDFDRMVCRVVRKMVTTRLPAPHFRAENF